MLNAIIEQGYFSRQQSHFLSHCINDKSEMFISFMTILNYYLESPQPHFHESRPKNIYELFCLDRVSLRSKKARSGRPRFSINKCWGLYQWWTVQTETEF